jgi:hypothetical protein
MTWYSAFASLMLMAGLAVWLSGRQIAALLVLILGVTGSFRVLMGLIPRIDGMMIESTGLAGWQFQAAWVPQHIAAAACVLLAAFMLPQLARTPSVARLVILALLVVAGFEASTWVGGVTFAFAGAWIALALLVGMEPGQRLAFVGRCTAVAFGAAILAAPFLYDQSVTTALRGGGPPVALRHFEVLGSLVPAHLRRMLDLPAYWLLLLTAELSAAYVIGVVALARFVQSPRLDPERLIHAQAFARLTAASLVVGWLVVSTVGDNNDLGWRAILPGAMALMVFAAAGLAQWIAARARLAVATAAAAILLALPGGIDLIYYNAVGFPNPAAQAFAATPEMWAAVRRHAKAEERIGNNPMFMHEMTPWPVNISWALMANRRSCYASHDLALPYVPLSRARLRSVDALFLRVFAGEGEPEDVDALATRYGCRIVVVTARDGAWTRDPFAASPHYRLVETSDRGWRIYAIREAALARR